MWILNWQNYLPDRPVDRPRVWQRNAHWSWHLQRGSTSVICKRCPTSTRGAFVWVRKRILLTVTASASASTSCESGQLKCFKVLYGWHINKCLHIYFTFSEAKLPLASIRCASCSCSHHVHNSTLALCSSCWMGRCWTLYLLVIWSSLCCNLDTNPPTTLLDTNLARSALQWNPPEKHCHNFVYCNGNAIDRICQKKKKILTYIT